MRPPLRGTTAVRILAILTAVVFCLAAAAYASTRSPGPEPDSRGPLRPRIIDPPDSTTVESTVEFDFSQPARPARSARRGLPPGFECRLDDGPWKVCEAPVTVSGVGRGAHRVQVRAVNHAGEVGPAAGFTWRRVTGRRPVAPPAPGRVAEEEQAPPAAGLRTREAPKVEDPEKPITRPFEPESPSAGPVSPIRPPEPLVGDEFVLEEVGSVEDLLPGAPAQTIGVRVVNPSPDPISVTSLTASIPVEPPDCPVEENFVLTPAAISPEAPLVVAPESSVSLPAAGVAGPTIAMRNLPFDQSACEDEELDLVLGAEAGE